MIRILLLLPLFYSLSLFGQGAPITEWAIKQGGTFNELSNAIATDKWGNIYTTGSFYTQGADFDPGPGVYNLSPNGYYDIFVTKTNQNGEFVWAVSIGGVDYEEGNGIDTDTFGNVYITGQFEGTIDADPGPEVYNLTTVSPNNFDVFIIKLDTNGALVWAKNIGHNIDSNQEDIARAITVDDNGYLYVVGDFYYTADFDPGSAVFNMTTNGYGNIFLLKLNLEGEFVWAKSLGDNRFDDGRGVTVDKNHNVYVTGYTSDASDEQDLLIVKINSTGDLVWEKNIEGTGDAVAVGYDLAVDEDENIYISGTVIGTVDLDAGPDTFLLSSGSDIYGDILVLKLDENGDFLWAYSVGNSNYDVGRAIALDKDKLVYIAGYFMGNVDFDPGPEDFTIYNNSTGEEDGFILTLDSDGSFIRAGSFHGNDGGWNFGLTIDDWNNIYTTGVFSFTTNFNPFNGFLGLTADQGGVDAFIQKMRTQPCSAIPSINGASGTLSICPDESSIVLSAEMPSWITSASYSWSTGETTDSIMVIPSTATDYSVNVNYLVDTVVCNGAASVEVNFAPPFDITITEDIETCAEQAILLEANGGTSYLWNTGETSNAITFTAEENQSYSVTVSDNYGCAKTDSITVLVNPLPEPMLNEDVEICAGDMASLTATGGGTYLWNTGDTTNTIIVSPSSEMEYSVTVTDTNNCMGFDSLSVFVNPTPQPMLGENQTICPGDSILLTATGGGSYLWNTLSTESSILVVPLSNTEYTITVTDNNGCLGLDAIMVFVNTLSDTTFVGFESCDSTSVGTITYVISDQNGCDSVLVETTTLVQIPDTPIAPDDVTIQQNDPPFEITIAEVPNAIEYVWSVPTGAQILSGVNTNTIVVDWGDLETGGLICVTAVNECFSSSEVCMEVAVDLIDAVNDPSRKNYLLFPNPAADIINVYFDDSNTYKLTLFDVFGKIVLPPVEFHLVDQVHLSIRQLVSGSYWLKIGTRDGVFWEKVEIVR